MIAAGGYREAGIHKANQDSQPTPAAVAYWRRQLTSSDNRKILTGGEIHAYQLSHYFDQRYVVSVPNLWMIGLMALIGKALTVYVQRQRFSKPGSSSLEQLSRRSRWLIFAAGTALCTGISFQLFVSTAVLLPVVLPVLTIVFYSFPALTRKKS